MMDQLSNRKKRGLGRGLDALLSNSQKEENAPSQVVETITLTPEQPIVTATTTNDGLKEIPIEFLQPGRYQPRQDMDQESLEELAASIRSQGIIQPIIIRPIGEKRYEIIAGERRWRAAQLAMLDRVPVVIKDIPDESAIEMALIENIQRENLNPIEEANALHRLMTEFNMTQEQAATVVGKSRPTISNLLRLLSLNHEVKILIEHGDIDFGHAKALLGLTGELQNEAARQVVAKDLSVRETEHLVRKLLNPKTTKSSGSHEDPNVRALKESLSDKLAAKVDLQYNAKGKGRLIVHYNSFDELDGIIDHIS